MNCKNHFCIYWKKNKCALPKTSLDILGCCQECVYVDIDGKVLEKERQRILKSYQDPMPKEKIQNQPENKNF